MPFEYMPVRSNYYSFRKFRQSSHYSKLRFLGVLVPAFRMLIPCTDNQFAYSVDYFDTLNFVLHLPPYTQYRFHLYMLFRHNKNMCYSMNSSL